MTTESSSLLKEASVFAALKHKGQFRKGTQTPYINHPLEVAEIVRRHGGSESQIIAALLHDTIEDCGVTAKEIENLFGCDAARIVVECTDADTTPKPPWKERKEKYIKHLPGAHPTTFLVSASDKLHNATAIVNDVTKHGRVVWERFNASPKEILWYYESLLGVFTVALASQTPALVVELAIQVGEMKKLVSDPI